jgi:hypothetical protein
LKNGILFSMPGFGTKDDEIVLNMLMQVRPIHRSVVWHFPKDMAVADARNEAVRMAQQHECEYVFFQDHDVIPPLDAIGRLMARDGDVVGGLYVSKQKPPWPLVIRDERPVTDWKYGDVVECDTIGMGCTLIRASVFSKMSEPWFRTVSEPGTDGVVDNKTEDAFFCQRLVSELGVHPYIDTAVLCFHKDLATGELFYYDPKLGLPAWTSADRKEVFSVKPVEKTKDVSGDAEVHGGGGCGGDAGGPGDGDGGSEHHEPV